MAKEAIDDFHRLLGEGLRGLHENDLREAVIAAVKNAMDSWNMKATMDKIIEPIASKMIKEFFEQPEAQELLRTAVAQKAKYAISNLQVVGPKAY